MNNININNSTPQHTLGKNNNTLGIQLKRTSGKNSMQGGHHTGGSGGAFLDLSKASPLNNVLT